MESGLSIQTTVQAGFVGDEIQSRLERGADETMLRGSSMRTEWRESPLRRTLQSRREIFELSKGLAENDVERDGGEGQRGTFLVGYLEASAELED
ncbi:uncharacterized protein ARMOST_21574 [Armillaria ostoyae]|uniref:Uncharacterized protein n=1 Tax=Armillaria ostoyae TaxID=47428 RepID=A0A284SAG5_ARMOS|nr:uncharacterized protein ARMOST_21574 [Armillaria ostoyae]